VYGGAPPTCTAGRSSPWAGGHGLGHTRSRNPDDRSSLPVFRLNPSITAGNRRPPRTSPTPRPRPLIREPPSPSAATVSTGETQTWKPRTTRESNDAVGPLSPDAESYRQAQPWRGSETAMSWTRRQRQQRRPFSRQHQPLRWWRWLELRREHKLRLQPRLQLRPGQRPGSGATGDGPRRTGGSSSIRELTPPRMSAAASGLQSRRRRV